MFEQTTLCSNKDLKHIFHMSCDSCPGLRSLGSERRSSNSSALQTYITVSLTAHSVAHQFHNRAVRRGDNTFSFSRSLSLNATVENQPTFPKVIVNVELGLFLWFTVYNSVDSPTALRKISHRYACLGRER